MNLNRLLITSIACSLSLWSLLSYSLTIINNTTTSLEALGTASAAYTINPCQPGDNISLRNLELFWGRASGPSYLVCTSSGWFSPHGPTTITVNDANGKLSCQISGGTNSLGQKHTYGTLPSKIKACPDRYKS